MARRGSVRVKDKGFKGLLRRVHIAARGAHVEVGILGETAAKPHKAVLDAEEKTDLKQLSSLKRKKQFMSAAQHARHESLKKKKAGSGITIGAIGEIHELGLGNNPVRSWLRGYVVPNEAKIKEKAKRVYKEVVAGRMTQEEGLELLGLSIKGGIQKRIAAGIAPQVTAATQARKGPTKTTPLINSGQFRSSINYRVQVGKP
jgi:hypothetical protein